MVGYGAKDPSTKSLTSTMSGCFTVLMIFYDMCKLLVVRRTELKQYSIRNLIDFIPYSYPAFLYSEMCISHSLCGEPAQASASYRPFSKSGGR